MDVRDVSDQLHRIKQQMAEVARVNETLQTEMTACRNTEAQLRAALGKKEALLKEIHHRVKNNMQIIASLLAMQTQSMTDARTIAMLKESQRRIRSMALVHQQLYQSADLGTINVGEYIQKLIADLADACGIGSGRIRIELHVPSIFWRIDTAVPCGLILTELISNAFKHAFPDGRTGEIHIELRTDPEGSVTMSVRDNGVGFVCELDGRKQDSLGLQLVSTLTDQLDGMMQLETHAGTAIHITFPFTTSLAT